VSGLPSRSRAEAPGKLMLAGEYAVLADHGLALAIAVPHGVAIEARQAEATVSAPARWQLRRAADDAAPDAGSCSTVLWTEGDEPVPEALRFVHGALERSLRDFGSERLPPLVLEARSTGEAASGDAKPGVGGSASATVAACAVLAHAADERDGEALLTRALAVHREAQGGRGSGYDVATICTGGLCAYRRRGAELASAEHHRWPGSLSVLAGYSGQSASTRAQLTKVAAIGEASPARLAGELRALGAPVPQLLDSLTASGDVDLKAVAEACRACHATLARWDATHDLGIVTPAIERLLAIAADHGVAAKIAGAGAGDSALAIADDPERLDALGRAWRAEGFRPYAMPVTNAGVVVTC
jgi:phosphomevalonate kinase